MWKTSFIVPKEWKTPQSWTTCGSAMDAISLAWHGVSRAQKIPKKRNSVCKPRRGIPYDFAFQSQDRDEPWIGYLWEFCSVFFSWGRGRLPGSVHQFHPESSNLSQVVGSREGTSFLSAIFGPKSIVRDPYESQVTEFTSSLHHVPTTKDTLGIPLKLVLGKIRRHHANPPCLKRRNISKCGSSLAKPVSIRA